MRPARSRLSLPAAAALAALAASPLAATTIVALSDAALVDRSPLVITGRVEGTLPSSHPGPYTDWLVSVERVHKGEAAASAIVVRVLGGDTADGGGSPSTARRASPSVSRCCSSSRRAWTAPGASRSSCRVPSTPCKRARASPRCATYC